MLALGCTHIRRRVALVDGAEGSALLTERDARRRRLRRTQRLADHLRPTTQHLVHLRPQTRRKQKTSGKNLMRGSGGRTKVHLL